MAMRDAPSNLTLIPGRASGSNSYGPPSFKMFTSPFSCRGWRVEVPMVGPGKIAGMPISELKGGFLYRDTLGKFTASGLHAHAQKIVVRVFSKL